jgi:hypothetical protein
MKPLATTDTMYGPRSIDGQEQAASGEDAFENTWERPALAPTRTTFRR